jgi:hypothetical protein
MKALLAMLLVAALAAGGCGSDDDRSACEEACARMEACSPAYSCDIVGDCSGSSLELANCILSRDCDEISECILEP